MTTSTIARGSIRTRPRRPSWKLGVGSWELTPSSLRRNFGHSYRMQPFEEPPGRVALEPRIRRFDAQEEAIGRRARERGNVEHRMVRLRQLVERPHAEKAG